MFLLLNCISFNFNGTPFSCKHYIYCIITMNAENGVALFPPTRSARLGVGGRARRRQRPVEGGSERRPEALAARLLGRSPRGASLLPLLLLPKARSTCSFRKRGGKNQPNLPGQRIVHGKGFPVAPLASGASLWAVQGTEEEEEVSAEPLWPTGPSPTHPPTHPS